MGLFTDIMGLVDLGERIARGQAADVKREIVDDVKRQRARAGAAAPPGASTGCKGAPPGFRCTGGHDERGNCMQLEQLDEPG